VRLSAAVLPPEPALQELVDVVRSVGPGTPELDPVPLDAMCVPVTSFGHVARRDAVGLATALRDAAATWPRPKLYFAGGTALEWPGDYAIWAKLAGDIDDLATVGRGVPAAVQRLGFFVDRRRFRPWLSVGEITDVTTAPYLERLVAALDGFHGQPWILGDLCLLQRRPVEPGERERFEVLERFPLGID
jgi:2'-5' RNA ligase